MALTPAKATKQINLIMAPDSSSRVTLADLVTVARSARESSYASSRQHATETSASSPTLLLAPLYELAEQSLAIGLGYWCASSDAIQEGLKIAADVFLC
jgi:hypothetical protein